MMQIITNAMLWVDIFFLLSGFLCAYSVLREVKQTSVRKYAGNILWKIIHRYIRLTPSLMAMIGFSIILEVMSSGPHWYQYIDLSQQSCHKKWWINILYVTNIPSVYTSLTEICLVHTWYLSADMQMFIVSPIFIILLTCNDIRKQYLGIAINIVVILASWTIIAINLVNNHAIGINVVIIYSTYFWFLGYSYHNFGSVLYGTIHRTVWSICWSYILYACASGRGGIINRILSWSALVPLSRLSFQIYLFHFVLVLAIKAALRQPLYFNSLTMVMLYFSITVLSLFVSFLAYVMFEIPIAKIENIIKKK
ncbi:nose resistant to fluoxetine protein 6-like [Oppia nitens]|uniref:nose resistant to fluoxetine protein 6-like n=1 Tax=Oppia nitens TaxID=1686743 RepID=UPI0023DA3384|nr:nose resistant to fluoxetine protein 6-like [Oppia nitens]